jgi:hypothetical protein
MDRVTPSATPTTFRQRRTAFKPVIVAVAAVRVALKTFGTVVQAERIDVRQRVVSSIGYRLKLCGLKMS